MKRIIYSLCFSFLLATNLYSQPQGHPLQITIKPDKETFALDEEINLQVTFTNTSPKKQRVLLYDQISPESISYSYFTLGLSKTNSLETNYISLKELYHATELPWYGQYLEPQQSATLTVPILNKIKAVDPYYNFHAEKYGLSLYYDPPAEASHVEYTVEKLSSNHIFFEIQDSPRKRNTLVENGTIKEYYSNESLRFTRPIVDGLPHGVSQEYYETGALKTETIYVNGKKEGLYKMYNLVGEILEEGQYKNDLKDGIFRGYHCCIEKAVSTEAKYDNGFLIYRREYYQNGLLSRKEDRVKGDILTKNFYENAQLKSESHRANCQGILCESTVTKNYNEQGVLESEILYQGINTLLSAKTYHSNGKIKEDWLYNTNGSLASKKTFDKDGKLISEEGTLAPQGEKHE